MIQFLADLKSAVKNAIANGLTLEQAKDFIKLEKYSNYGFPNTRPISIAAVYNELKKKDIN